MMRHKTSVWGKLYWALFLTFMYLPIAVMIVFSFNESKSRTLFTGFTTKWYTNLFHNEMILNSLAVSLLIAAISSVLVAVLGTAAAVGINSMKRKSRAVVMNITYIPYLNPEIITGVSMMLLFVMGQGGVNWVLEKLNMPQTVLFGIPTLVIAHITFNLPIVIFSVLPKLKQMDIRLYEAALDLGCNPAQAFFKVVLPEIMPGITAGFLMAFTYSIDDFIISYFTSGTVQTLPIAIYSMTRKKVSPEINALSTIMFGVILLIVMLNSWREDHREKRLARKGPEETGTAGGRAERKRRGKK